MPHVSKSQLNELMECPKAYWFHRRQGVDGKNGIGAVLGSTYHKIWELFFKSKLKTGNNRELEWCLDTFRTEWEKRLKEEIEAETIEFEKGDEEKGLDTGVGLVTAYYEYAKALDPLMVEKHYELSLPGLPDWTLYGYIDLIYKSYLVDGEGKPLIDPETGQQKWGAVVVDHKTTGSRPHSEAQEGAADAWQKDHEFSQEAIGYAFAYRVVTGKKELRFEYHWAVKLKQPKIMVTSLKFDDMHLNWYMSMAIEQIERIKRGFFERNLTSWKHSPRFCPAWNLCHNIPETGNNRIKVV